MCGSATGSLQFGCTFLAAGAVGCEGLTALTPLANGEDPAAEFKLGVMNSRGWVGKPLPDYSEARSWYEKSADQGFAPAEAALGAVYFNGFGVPRDYKMARYWWEKAAAPLESFNIEQR